MWASLAIYRGRTKGVVEIIKKKDSPKKIYKESNLIY